MLAFDRTVARLLILGCVMALGLGLATPAQAAPQFGGVASAGGAVRALVAPAISAAPAAAAGSATRPAGSYVPLPSARLIDTRSGLGSSGPLVVGREMVVPVAAMAGIPGAGASAIVLNVTVVDPTATGFLTVYPDGDPRPSTSNINVSAGQIVANTVIVRLGAGGRLRFSYSAAGSASTQVIVDATGYYTGATPTSAGTFQVLPNQRIMDTRTGLGGVRASVQSKAARVLMVTGTGGVPSSGVRAVVINVAEDGATAAGSLTLYARTSARPGTSNLNFVAGQTRANLTIVPVSSAGQITLFNGSARAINTIVDVVGYYLDGYPGVLGSFLTFNASRVLDTTTGLGASARPVAPNGQLTVQVGGLGEIPGPGTTAVALNVTVTPSSAGYLSVYPTGTATPSTSNINYAAGVTVSNLVIVPVGADGKVVLFNDGSGRTDIRIDVLGVFLDGTGVARCNLARVDPSGTSITQWNPVVYCVLSALGQPSSAMSDVDTMILYESSGDPNAINNYDSNWKAGHPSEGLIQVIKSTFETYRSFQLPDDQFNPAANLFAGLNYAINTYGSIHNVPGLVSLRGGGGYVGYIAYR